MGRHSDWSALIGLVGGGQEINSGEYGVTGWGDALRELNPSEASRWSVYAPEDVLTGGPSTGGLALGDLPEGIDVHLDNLLQLEVPIRSYRSPKVSEWVHHVLSNDVALARQTAKDLTEYPVLLTRSLSAARDWLKEMGRGQRRYGLVASSGARRLRAEGLGLTLSARERAAIAHWYLNPRDDIRSSYALEVPANEYTTQGLELDLVGVCWGGDLIRSTKRSRWVHRRLAGNRWNRVSSESRQQYITNSYRVLLTRAREGLVIWVPPGEASDSTRDPKWSDATTEYLLVCGAREL